MGYLSTPRDPANVTVRPHLPHSFAYRRKAFRMLSAWSVSCTACLRSASHRVECDKSFTRSDALAKHMRIQHNISPPLPGRGGSRKRKREEPEPTAPQADPNQYGYTTFKLDSNGNPDDPDDPRIDPAEHQNGIYASGSGAPRPGSPEFEDHDDGEEEIPQYLLMQADPQTGLIMGRSPTMVKYLIMKAKHRYAVEQHEALVEELRVLRKEERLWKERKDALMDELLHVYFGLVKFAVAPGLNAHLYRS